MAAFNLTTQVDGICFDLVQQYFQCKRLKMVFTEEEGWMPNSKIKNNFLNDTFYKSQNLSRMSLDEGFALIKKIYTETSDCESDFCDCVSVESYSQIAGEFADFSILFTNSTNFPHVKTIISEFNNKNRPNLLPFEEIRAIVDKNSESSTLAKFCIDIEWSLEKYSYYQEIENDCHNENKTVNNALVIILLVIYLGVLEIFLFCIENRKF